MRRTKTTNYKPTKVRKVTVKRSTTPRRRKVGNTMPNPRKFV